MMLWDGEGCSMKTIEFQGAEYQVQDWVNWVAMDDDGELYGYENKPYKTDGEWFPQKGGRTTLIHSIEPDHEPTPV